MTTIPLMRLSGTLRLYGNIMLKLKIKSSSAISFPSLAEIIDWHRRGTRYGIKLDEDGLLRAGKKGVQLTWMDALVNGEVITPPPRQTD